ncbi:LytR/AlgR family response regulator transcription factor [Thalassotalea agarivorans]|uniref:Two component transcriptional regulator, LytTR family n=1 Tax=Thalassotalea agarivorans TaxID=349064 RepID=A0A1I0FMA2_THASX|nr:LytTR family DNA-binding domain-containing protein [Thalassotalea agarivorans]SET59193.1 two component transcriptional regulator, LytTR family [Thalassotalea agarivorans]
MTKIRTIIVDDEPLALSLMEAKLGKFDNIDVIAKCKNGKEAIAAILDLEPDLVFLDIDMPKINGFEVIHNTQSELTPMVVFATAYEQYALDAFKVNAVDYILKPLDDELLARAVHRAQERFAQHDKSKEKYNLLNAIEAIRSHKDHNYQHTAQDDKKIVVKDGDQITVLKQDEIKWIDAAGDYCCLHANGETHIKRTSLTELLKQLEPANFKRVHRSTIINLNFISKVQSLPKGEYFVELGAQERVKVSRTYKEAIREYLQLNPGKKNGDEVL